ncbi:MAG: GNAT family N-acetyltransferase [Oscillospiraceae bacterium]|jgi:ribosomal-protein-alanine N-acetyltransferase|nr:GNAT family N-acetyltransferase [Oscillospiraceae bacterium]
MITYRQATLQDIDTIANMSRLLYSPSNTLESLRAEAAEHLQTDKWATFLAFDGETPVGLCEVTLRTDYVEGTESGGVVGYLEGIYVSPDYRNRHIAKSLVEIAEKWSAKQGCAEFASDCKLDNTDSLAFHLKIGFEEAGRNIHFVKKLPAIEVHPICPAGGLAAMTHKGTVALETERLILRRFTLEDANAAHKNWFSDPDVAMYMRWDAHTDISQTQEFIRLFVGSYEKPDFYRWAITLKQDGQAIGAIGFQIDSEYDGVADVSYTLCKAFWHQGIVSEALKEVLRFALLEVGVNRVEAFHAVSNPASGRVMQKAGMILEGHARQKYRSHRGLEDSDLYAILAEDYRKDKES